MRDIIFDFRVGGGSVPEILYGTVSIYGTQQAPHGTGWVVTSETTLRLVNGQATLTGALERPSDGSLGHYHMIARDNCGRGATFRKFLPAGAGATSLTALPDAWWQTTNGVGYWWAGTPNASPSLRTVGGVISRVNYAPNPQGVTVPVPYGSGATITPNVTISGHPNGLTKAVRVAWVGGTTGNPGIDILTPSASTPYLSRLWVYHEALIGTGIGQGWAQKSVSGQTATAPVVGVWREISWPYSTAASTNAIGFRITGNTAGKSGSFLLTGIQVEANVAALGPYFDGSTKV